MSYAVFPVLSGLTWNTKKRPEWSTAVMVTAAGNEFRTGYRQYPITEFDLSYSYMNLSDKLTMEGFFNQQQGQLTPFYFDAQNDDSVSVFGFGTGDGATKTFTLYKPAGAGGIEPVGGVNGSPSVYVNGTLTSVTVSGNTVTFTTAPALNAVLTWTGNYYYLVRFGDDKLEFNQFANQMYELQDCTLRVVR